MSGQLTYGRPCWQQPAACRQTDCASPSISGGGKMQPNISTNNSALPRPDPVNMSTAADSSHRSQHRTTLALTSPLIPCGASFTTYLRSIVLLNTLSRQALPLARTGVHVHVRVRVRARALDHGRGNTPRANRPRQLADHTRRVAETKPLTRNRMFLGPSKHLQIVVRVPRSPSRSLYLHTRSDPPKYPFYFYRDLSSCQHTRCISNGTRWRRVRATIQTQTNARTNVT